MTSKRVSAPFDLMKELASHPPGPGGSWVRWDDDGTVSVEAAGDCETVSFEAHVAARFGAP